jgi:tripartite-type tricarboxylate transporter receptor subunit TctC
LIADKSGYSIFFSSLSPFIAATIIEQKASYKLKDLAFVNGQWTDWDILFVRNDSKYKSLAELIGDAKMHPGALSVAVVQGSPSYLSTLLLLQAANIGNDITVVPYRGGNDARLAVIGGHVQFTLVPAQETATLKEKIRPLAVLREDRSPDWDAPTIAEALKPLGFGIPLIKGTTRGMAVSADFKNRYPDRYDKLVQTYQAILARGEVQDNLRKLGLGGDWLGPERTTAAIENGFQTLEKYQSLVNAK